MNYFDVTNAGFTLRVYYEEKLGVVTITDVRLQSQVYGGTWFPGGTIRVNDIPVLTMSYNAPATHSFYFFSIGEDFVQSSPKVSGSSEKILANKATLSVDVTLYRNSNTDKIKLSGSVTIDLSAGVVYIGRKAYMPHIFNGESWVAYGAYKGNGATFDMFS